MPRLNYTAPGVYVEEVPSVVQAIAGVGTNTVGFIGIVPDQIEIPKPNPKYDPEAARTAAAGGAPPKAGAASPGGTDPLAQDKERLQAEIKRIEDSARAESDAAKRKEIEEPLKGSQGLRAKLAEVESKIAAAKSAAFAKPAAGGDDSKLLPYEIEKFNVKEKVDALDTKLCTNFSEYASRFGGFPAHRPNEPDDVKYHRALTHAVAGFFSNGGTRCFVARLKTKDQLKNALEAFESIDEVAIVAAPGLPAEQATWTALIEHCDVREDRFAILDCPEKVEDDKGFPDMTKLDFGKDGPNNFLPGPNKNAAYYFPYIEVVDPAKKLQDEDPARDIPSKYRGRVYVPPSGHIAGIYARTDEERGVHKAPANCVVRGAVDLKYYVSTPKQEFLNPRGVNCIRNMNGNIVVWGARTIGGDKNGEWKYINVRRLFLFLRESIDEGTQWAVFEPNDQALWGKVRRNVTAFLTNVWRAGALFGSTPDEAFYVKCDAETNPPEIRELGQMVCEVGVSIVRPAEFVIFRVTQSIGPRTT